MTISRLAVSIRNGVIGWFYRHLLRPIFFAQDPERVHDRMVNTGRIIQRTALGRTVARSAFGYFDQSQSVDIAGIHFPNPIGLAAGFDKHADLTGLMDCVGFGFMEIGSVTGTPGPGNSKPRLWRLPKSKSLVIHYGLNSEGSGVIAEKLRAARRSLPLGISIAKANLPECDDIKAGIADYRRAARDLAPLADYLTINISCPNTTGGEPFTNPENLRLLLNELVPELGGKPSFIKLTPDQPDAEIDALTDAALEFPITGFIVTNLTKDRQNPAIKDQVLPPRGGISGKILEEKSNRLLARLRRRYGSKVVLIGVGGIFTAEDAFKKIRLGASLVQLFTGMIYQGPQAISSINLGLAEHLRRGGFHSPLEAVGVDV